MCGFTQRLRGHRFIGDVPKLHDKQGRAVVRRSTMQARLPDALTRAGERGEFERWRIGSDQRRLHPPGQDAVGHGARALRQELAAQSVGRAPHQLTGGPIRLTNTPLLVRDEEDVIERQDGREKQRRGD